MFTKLLFLNGLTVVAGLALPETTPKPDPALVARADPITNFSQLNASLSSASKNGASSFAAGYTALYQAIKPSAAPTNTASAMSRIASVYSAYPSNPLAAGAGLLLAGVAGQSSIGNPIEDAEYFGPTCNSVTNNNPPPPQVIYPQKAATDPPYQASENTLRSAIYIPSTFTYGKVKPVIFIPGSGVEACENWAPNLGRLFTGSNYADPVYLNIPKNSLVDIQTSSEFTSYAVNYISSVSGGGPVTIVTWSQGAPSAQWSLKYWKSIRSSVSDFIAISPDFHGTVFVPLICPPGVPCAPSVIQQNYNSNFITKLRSNGGDSAFVPTTTIHSIYDEIVEPQQDPFASGNLGSANGQPVTNVQIQSVCGPNTPAGFPAFGHENAIYNPVTFAVAVDAIKNAGSANVARSGASSVCGTYYTNGLSLSDVFATEALIPLAGYNIETYDNKTTVEPPIRSYATY